MTNVEYLTIPTEEEGRQSRRARATQNLHNAIRDGSRALKNLPVFLKEALEIEAWKDRPTPNGGVISNSSFQEWVEAAYPRGLDASIDVIHSLLRDDNETRDMFDQAVKGRHGGANNPYGRAGKPVINVDNINVDLTKRPTGTSADAALRRLRKESETGNERAVTILPRVLANDMSPHRALVELGIRKATLTIVDSAPAIQEAAIKKSGAVETARAAWFAMTNEERAEFIGWAATRIVAVPN